MINFNSNFASFQTRRSLENSTNILNQAIERMSTGFKVNHASDNAANSSIIKQQDIKLSSLDVAEDNTCIGLDLVTTASDTLELINSRFTRLRNLAVQAENNTHGKQSLDAINEECQSLVKEIKSIYQSAEFNGLKIYGAEFFETVSTDGTAAVQTYTTTPQPQATTSYATEDTTLQELGIDYSSFEIYNSDGELIESYDTEKNDTIGDIFGVLSTYGFTTSITDGVISISSSNGRYVNGDLMEKFGIDLDSTEFISSSSQLSDSAVCYTTTLTATEASTLADMGILLSGTDVVTINNKYGEFVKDITVSSNTTFGGLFNSLADYDIQGSIDEGIISFSSSNGNYLAQQGIIATLGIGAVESSSAVTTGTSQTSAGVVTYESILVSGGEVTTLQEEKTVTVYTTTTASETVTNTIWTTTTTSQTSTLPVVYTTYVTATEATTLGELGITDGMTYKIRAAYNRSSIYTYTVSATETLGSFMTNLRNRLGNDSTITLNNGVIEIKNPRIDAPIENKYLYGDVATALGISYETFNSAYNAFSFGTEEVSFTTIDTTVTSMVTAGSFKESINPIDISAFTAIASLAETDTLQDSTTYSISSTEELIQFKNMVNNGLCGDFVTIVLGNNIDLSDTEWDSGIGNLYGFFNFNGNGYTISNLTGSSGLFDYIQQGSIRNLGLVNVNITTSTSSRVGALINSSSMVNIENSFVTGSIISTSTSTPGPYIGGFVGDFSNGRIKDSYSSIQINCGTANTGGLIAYASGDITITNSYTEGSIVSTSDKAKKMGGVIGSLDGSNIEIQNIQSSMTLTNPAEYTSSPVYTGGIIGFATYLENINITNCYFNGVLNADSKYHTGAIVGELEASMADVPNYNISNIGCANSDYSLISNDNAYSCINASMSSKIKDYFYTFTITITKTDGSTIVINDTQVETFEELTAKLREHDLGAAIASGVQYRIYGLTPGTTFTVNGEESYSTSGIRNLPSSTLQKIETSTVDEETTIYTTTTTSTTETETIYTTTTTSTTETQTIDVTVTAAASETTLNVSMTSDTTFALLGLTSRGYITVMNDSTKTIITVKTGDTVGGLAQKLNTAGILTELNNGKLELTPSNKKIYIAGMSDNIRNSLELTADFYSTSLGVEMTDSNVLINNNAITTIRNSTSLSEVGVTSGELVVKKDGNNDVTIAVSESQSVAEFVSDLQNAGLDANCQDGQIFIQGNGDIYLASSDSNSSNAISVFKLGNVAQTMDATYSNTDSTELNKLAEIVNTYWKANGAIKLQVGTNADDASQIEINTGFTIEDLDKFTKIGKKMVSGINFIEELDSVLNTIYSKQTELGVYTNRLESVLEEISIKYDNLVASRSTLRDADIAEESSLFIQQQILQQASATLLSVTNHSPQLALQLL